MMRARPRTTPTTIPAMRPAEGDDFLMTGGKAEAEAGGRMVTTGVPLTVTVRTGWVGSGVASESVGLDFVEVFSVVCMLCGGVDVSSC